MQPPDVDVHLHTMNNYNAHREYSCVFCCSADAEPVCDALQVPLCMSNADVEEIVAEAHKVRAEDVTVSQTCSVARVRAMVRLEAVL